MVLFFLHVFATKWLNKTKSSIFKSGDELNADLSAFFFFVLLKNVPSTTGINIFFSCPLSSDLYKYDGKTIVNN